MRKSKISTLIEFLNTRLIFHLGFGIMIGLALFGAEIIFSYSLQAFLASIGVSKPDSLNLPVWLSNQSFARVMVLVFVVGSARTFLQWVQIRSNASSNYTFLQLQRARIVTWAFSSRSVNSSSVMNLYHEKVSNGTTFISNFQTSVVQGTTSILLLWSLFAITPYSTLMIFLLAATIFLILKILDQRIRITAQRITEISFEINQRILVSIKNLILLQIYGTAELEQEKIQACIKDYSDKNLLTAKLSGIKYVLPQLLGITFLCLVSFSWRANGGGSPGQLVTYFYLFVRFVQNIAAVIQSTTQMMVAYPDINGLYQWWKQNGRGESVVRRPLLKQTIELVPPIGWEVNDVTYSYGSTANPVLKNFNAEVLPGQTLAIKGESGSGKSTLLSLILGYLQPNSGEIYIRSGSKKLLLSECRPSVLQHIGYAGSDTFLVEGTIYDNLVYGLSRIPTSDEVQAALIQAECQFVLNLEMGLNHFLTEQGQGLSAGQKQRISLARALLRQPTAIILDEITSNLDSETEKKLIETLKKLKGKTTIILVTHREALLQLADKIITLEENT